MAEKPVTFHNAAYFLLLVFLAGCGNGKLTTQPVSGKVSFNRKPLTHGTVILQPDVGPVAQGEIQKDGSFRLSSYQPNDGAVIGRHRVTVVSRGKPRNGPVGEPLPGKLLIPEKYTNAETSGIDVDIKPSDNKPLLVELTGPAPK